MRQVFCSWYRTCGTGVADRMRGQAGERAGDVQCNLLRKGVSALGQTLGFRAVVRKRLLVQNTNKRLARFTTKMLTRPSVGAGP